MEKTPLLPLPQGCVVGRFIRRYKRFSVEMLLDGQNVWVHSNNSGSMLGLTLAGAPLLASPAANPARKLPYTQEAVWLAERAVPPLSGGEEGADGSALGRGFWVGVNTSVPNRMIEVAFHAGRLAFAAGYTQCRREAKRGESRLDACLTGPDLPPLWVECKNVTMVEDGVACFPDAATERGQKHLRDSWTSCAAANARPCSIWCSARTAIVSARRTWWTPPMRPCSMRRWMPGWRSIPTAPR